MHPDYFEGVLQLRNPTEEIIAFIDHELETNGRTIITKEEKHKDGIDLYLTSNGFLQKLAKRLKQKFGGELKINVRLHTRDRQTSKLVYRVNVYYRYVPEKHGSIATIRGVQYRILSQGTKVYVQNVVTGEKKYITFDTLREAEPVK